MTNLKTVAETAAELGQDVAESVEEFGRTAGRKLAEVRDNTGSALHAAASSVRQGSKSVNKIASGAAGRLDASASFVEGFTSKNVLAKVRQFGRSHVTGFVVAGLAIGFLAGTAMTRATRPRA
jgi:ElaB/YqjD/DUF883 family membrane-anchored ribosome-binding protein